MIVVWFLILFFIFLTLSSSSLSDEDDDELDDDDPDYCDIIMWADFYLKLLNQKKNWVQTKADSELTKLKREKYMTHIS